MALDVLGPANAPNSTTARPADDRSFGATDTWFKDCTTPVANDGTKIKQSWLNAVSAFARNIIRMNGNTAGAVPIVTENNADDAMAVKAIQHMIQRGQTVFGIDTGTANNLVVALIPAMAEYKRGTRILVLVGTASTAGISYMNVNGLGNRQIVGHNNRKLRRGEIQPGLMAFIDTGTAWEIEGSDVSGRTLLQGNLNLYVATTGSDTNDGLDPGTPFLTLQRSWSEVLNNYDLNGYVVNVFVANGTYLAGVTATAAPIGSSAGTGAVTFRSTSGIAANVIIAVTGANAFTAQGGAQFTLLDMQVQTAGAGTSCLVTTNGGIIAFNGLRFAGSINAHINAAGGLIQATGNYTITGNAAYHLVASAGGKASISGVTVTITGTPTFTTAFAYSQQGRVEAIGTIFSGAALGSKYISSENGVITVNGAGTSFLPGSTAGSSVNGLYV